MQDKYVTCPTSVVFMKSIDSIIGKETSYLNTLAKGYIISKSRLLTQASQRNKI